MKRVWKFLLIALSILVPMRAYIVVAQLPSPPPAIESPAPSTTKPTSTPQPAKTEPPTEAPSPQATSTPEATDKPSSSKPDEKAAEPAPSPEEIARQQKMMEADRLYLGGQYAAAEKIYREVKAPFPKEAETKQLPDPITDPAQLSPAGKVYWREAEAGIAQKLQTRAMVPLQLLVEQYPQFVPGQVRMAQVLQQYERHKEALDVLERATTLYPDQPDLLKAKVAALAESKKWIEASLAARQFALIYSNHPEAPEFTRLAEENLKRYKRYVRREIRGNAIANVITGALGYALTGNIFGPISAIQTTALLLKGEGAVGESVAKRAKKQLEMVKDEAVLNYVNELGQRLAHVAGRNDFEYEFNVVMEDDLNAFALPGGKIFINAGAITRTDSEAELAGLVAHELSHAVLSHGFQLVTQGNLLSNVTQFIPYGGTIADLFTLSYSRDMERQADIMGTRLIASTGYAADGERNLMVKLNKEQKSSPPAWLASHPVTKDRIRYLEELIEQNGYNRYTYEGVERHSQIKEQVKKILAEKKQREEEKKKNEREMRN